MREWQEKWGACAAGERTERGAGFARGSRERTAVLGAAAALGVCVCGAVAALTQRAPMFTARFDVAIAGLLGTQVFAADMDGDGAVDVVSIADGAVQWYSSGGGEIPAFSPHALAAVPGSLPTVAAPVDIDGDGWFDVVAAWTRGALHRNLGGEPLSFEPREIDPVGG